MIRLNPVSISEAARYMGVKGEPDDAVRKLIERADEIARKNIVPKYVYRISEAELLDSGVMLVNLGLLLTGNDIKKHLSGCRKAVVFAATLSSQADKLIRQAGVTDVADALAMDCVCSALIEQVCDKAEEEIFGVVKVAYRTWRFSPGYGDLPITLQEDLLKALNAQRRIGLTVTSENIMVPSKSVTAIIGISDVPVKDKPGKCELCNMRGKCSFSVECRK